MPEGYYSYSGFSFLASPRGEIYLSLGTKIVAFDVVFDASHFDEVAEQGIFGDTRFTRNSR